jgi:MFS family permease
MRRVASADASGKITGRQWLVLLLLLGSQFMLSVDFSILNVALPQVGAGVGMGADSLPWIATAYALPTAGFTLLFGRVADLFGRRRMFLIGVALLAVSSLIGGIAASPAVVLIARALQGFATAIATPAALSLLTTSFTDEKQRARVLGLNGALLSAGFTAGALVGGMLVGALSWRWAFLINVPVALLILVLTPLVVRTSKAPTGVKLDVPGAVTVTSGLLAFAYGVTNRSVPALVAGLVLLAIFWLIELRARAPLASVRILNRPSVKWGNLGGILAIGLMTGILFLLTLYLQDVLHFSAPTTGLVFGVPGIASVFAGILAGRVINRYGARTVLTVGLGVQGVLAAPLLLLGTSPASLAILLPTLFIAFYGHVTALVAYTVIATSGLPNSEQGLATGLVTLAQTIAITIGIPIVSAVAAVEADLLDGLRFAAGFEVVAMLIGVALIWRGLRPRRDVAETEPDGMGPRQASAMASASQ